MFCLASVGVSIKSDADRDRLTVLALRPRRGDGGDNQWPLLKDKLYNLGRDEDLPARLMRRSLDLLPITLKNIAVFVEAAVKKFGSQREGDQYGTLMAGAWSLCSGTEATPELATGMIEQYDWSEHVEHTETNDSEMALMTLLSAKIRASTGELSVYEVICSAVGRSVEGYNMEKPEARALLRRHGLAIWTDKRGDGSDHLLISNRHPHLKNLLAGTPYALDLRGQLLRHSKIKKHDTTADFSGFKSKSVSIALVDFLNNHQEEAGGGQGERVIEEAPF
jgi:putative DNA primase/helicase